MEIIDQLSNLSLEEDEIQTHETLIVQNNGKTLEAKKTPSVEKWEGLWGSTQSSPKLHLAEMGIKEKLVDNEKFTKARLCARDFEEEWNFRTDSPTCSREGLDLPCSIITWKKWTLNSLDIKTPFSQVKAIERTVYVRPPKKANTSEVWKLQKCIYDLADATRFWYLKLKEERIRLGALISTLGKGIFI